MQIPKPTKSHIIKLECRAALINFDYLNLWGILLCDL